MSKVIETTSTEVATRPNAKVTPTTTVNGSVTPSGNGGGSSRGDNHSVTHNYYGETSPASSSSPPSDTIIISVMVMMGSALIKDVSAGHPSVKPIVSGMTLGAALLILGTFAPTLARMLAITGMIGALLTNGSALIKLGSTIGSVK